MTVWLLKECLELVLLLCRALEQIKVMNERTPHVRCEYGAAPRRCGVRQSRRVTYRDGDRGQPTSHALLDETFDKAVT